MENLKVWVIGGLLGLVVLLGGLVLGKPAPAPTVATPSFGALSGPDIPSPYLRWGDVLQWAAGPATNATSSVLCAIQNTYGTSTILSAGIRVDTTGLGAQTFDISTSSSASNGFASSTPALIYAGTLPVANATYRWMAGVLATTSSQITTLMPISTSNNSPYIIAPNEYLVFKIATGTPGTFASYVTGQCTARFQAL